MNEDETQQCEIERWSGRGYSRVSRRCTDTATHLYTNGAYRRLECDACATQTRAAMRVYADGPQPTIEPLEHANDRP